MSIHTSVQYKKTMYFAYIINNLIFRDIYFELNIFVIAKQLRMNNKHVCLLFFFSLQEIFKNPRELF